MLLMTTCTCMNKNMITLLRLLFYKLKYPLAWIVRGKKEIEHLLNTMENKKKRKKLKVILLLFHLPSLIEKKNGVREKFAFRCDDHHVFQVKCFSF